MEDDKVIEESRRLPMEDRVVHTSWKARVAAYEDMDAACRRSGLLLVAFMRCIASRSLMHALRRAFSGLTDSISLHLSSYRTDCVVLADPGVQMTLQYSSMPAFSRPRCAAKFAMTLIPHAVVHTKDRFPGSKFELYGKNVDASTVRCTQMTRRVSALCNNRSFTPAGRCGQQCCGAA